MSENNGIVWEEPDKPGGAYTDWNAVLQPLRDNPGKWARLRVFQSQGGASGFRERLKHARKLQDRDRFDITTNKREDGFYVYARYVALTLAEERP